MTKLITGAGATLAAVLTTLGLAATAHAAPVCTTDNKGGAAANKQIVLSSCRDWGTLGEREYAVLRIGSRATAVRSCTVRISSVFVDPLGRPVRWTGYTERRCEDALRKNVSKRYWGTDEETHDLEHGKTVACLYLGGRKLGSCVYSPTLI